VAGILKPVQTFAPSLKFRPLVSMTLPIVCMTPGLGYGVDGMNDVIDPDFLPVSR